MRQALFVALMGVVGSSPVWSGVPPSRQVAREPMWRGMDVWRQPQGLPQNTVYSVLQSKDGYLWAGTKAGLARFDGVRFTTYDDTQPNQLKENEVWSVIEAPDGSLWMATFGGGAVRMKDGLFTSYGTREGLLSDYAATVAVDRDGAIWIGGDGGVNVLKNGRSVAQFTVKDGLAQKGVRSFWADPDGTMWVGAIRGGINRIKDGKVHPVSIPDLKPAAELRRFHRDRRGVLWIATTEGLVRLADGAPPAIFTSAHGLSSDRLYAVYEDPEGHLWIGTDKGLDRHVDGRFVQVPLGNEVAAVEQIDAIFTDREGSLWVGSLRDGLARLKQGLFLSYTADDGLADNYTATVFEDRSGRMWIGTARGLNMLHDGVLHTFTIPNASNRINSLAQDLHGDLWVGTNEGAHRLRYECGPRGCAATFTPFRLDTPSGGSFIRIIYCDPDGVMWIGTNLDGLLQLRDGRWTTYSTANGLSDNAVRGLVRDRDGGLWIGTRGGGLNHLKDGRLTTYRTKDGLANDNVQSLYMDRAGTLWVSTRQGVTRVHDGRFTTYRVADGLFSNYVYAFAEDDRGNLWMSCSKGIFRIAQEELDAFAAGKRRSVTSVAYGLEHGLATTVATISHYPSGFRSRDGRIWFATFKGAAVIDPARLTRNTLPPPVHIEDVTADGRGLPVDREAELPAGRGDITFRFTGLSFLAPEKMRFRYRLEGYDAEWTESGTRRVAYYTNIPPGSYRFRVAASNNDGVWNEVGASFRFRQAPRFHQTYSFLALCGLGVAALGAATQRLRVRYLKAREAELSRRVEGMVADMKVMHGLLPICASCKKIRDDGGYWNQIETYIQSHSQAEFSHSVCPDCTAKLYPDYHAAMETPGQGRS